MSFRICVTVANCDYLSFSFLRKEQKRNRDLVNNNSNKKKKKTRRTKQNKTNENLIMDLFILKSIHQK